MLDPLPICILRHEHANPGAECDRNLLYVINKLLISSFVFVCKQLGCMLDRNSVEVRRYERFNSIFALKKTEEAKF